MTGKSLEAGVIFLSNEVPDKAAEVEGEKDCGALNVGLKEPV
jgi:hypothetical protein